MSGLALSEKGVHLYYHLMPLSIASNCSCCKVQFFAILCCSPCGPYYPPLMLAEKIIACKNFQCTHVVSAITRITAFKISFLTSL